MYSVKLIGEVIMKILKNVLLTTLILTISTFAQNKTEKVIPADGISVVVISSSEVTNIKRSNKNIVQITSYLFKKGSVWGVKKPAERPSFEAMYRISNDTLFIQTPKRFTPKVIGINTYSEKIESILEIPFSKKILIKKAGQLFFSDTFLNVIVKKSERVSSVDLTKKDIALLKCKASEKLIINGINKSLDFELVNVGKQNIQLNSHEIVINIK